MRIAILSFGSRGDVQPTIALGRGLQAAGNDVRLVTHQEFEPLVRSYGLDFAPVRSNPKDYLGGEAGIAALESGQNPVRFIRRFMRIARDVVMESAQDCFDGCQGMDALVYTVTGYFGAAPVSEKLGIPAYAAFLQPISPTRSFSFISFPTQVHLGGNFNRLSYSMGYEMSWQLLRPALNHARREILNLPPAPLRSPFERMLRNGLRIVYGFSRHVVPHQPDWGYTAEVTGYWFLDALQEWQPPRELTDFLEAGPPPVYIGFGSMVDRDSRDALALKVEALKLAGQRGVLLEGYGEEADMVLPDSVLRVRGAPHDWLFPRMSALVHHCGAGTTAAGLRAGIPTVPVPYFSDQPFWAQRLAQLGAATRPIPRQRLTAESLAAAIKQAVLHAPIRKRAQELGVAIRSENGVQCAVERLQEQMAKSRQFGS